MKQEEGPKSWRDFLMHPTVEHFEKFSQVLYHNRDKNATDPATADHFPYRVGSYYFYEANNQTKQFKTAIFMNMTS